MLTLQLQFYFITEGFMSKYLQVISFDIPYPANYGGAIDVFYTLKALNESGVKIILHCFEYNRVKAPELELICEKVYYYHRNTSFFAHLTLLPYSVFSRKNKLLIQNLLNDEYPILFEGLMSCYYLTDVRLKDRLKLYREANIEHEYYRELARSAQSIIPKLYFLIESYKFKLFEPKLQSADSLIAVSQSDASQLQHRFPNKLVKFVPCFHPNNELVSLPGKSDYLLYHANLSVSENEFAAIYLCEKVFSKLTHSCIIAGLNPTNRLRNIVSKYPNIQLEANTDSERMRELVQNAQVNVLVTFQGTGLKLKLLNTLFMGRHVLVNKLMLEGSGLDALCTISDIDNEQVAACNRLMNIPFTLSDIELRKNLLFPQFSNSVQAKVLADLF